MVKMIKCLVILSFVFGFSVKPADETFPQMNIARIDHEMIFSGDKVWALSGATFTKGKFSLCNSMEFYDDRAGKWTLINEFPIPRCSFEALHAKNSFYILGGRDEKDTVLNDLQLFNIKTNKWKSLAPMNIARDKHAAVQIKDKIYVVGGRSGKAPFTMEVYDIRNNTWNVKSEFQAPRHPVGAVTDGKYFYLLSDTVSKSMTGKIILEKYDPATNKWTRLPDLPTPRCDAPVVFTNGRIVVLGGWTPRGNTAKSEAFDLKTNQWETLTDLKNPCQFHEAELFKGKILITGGCRQLPMAEKWVWSYTL